MHGSILSLECVISMHGASLCGVLLYTRGGRTGLTFRAFLIVAFQNVFFIIFGFIIPDFGGDLGYKIGPETACKLAYLS